MWASASTSSGSTGTNCEEVQHAVQPLHGTSESRSPRIASREAHDPCRELARIDRTVGPGRCALARHATEGSSGRITPGRCTTRS